MNNVKKFFAVITSVATMLSFTACDSKDSDRDKDSKSDGIIGNLGEDTGKSEKDLIPNSETDFIYSVITAEQYPGMAGLEGGIMIDRYVGASNETIVIPETINGKYVVAINKFAFCPYTEGELTYEYDGDGSVSFDKKMSELMAASGDFGTFGEDDYINFDKQERLQWLTNHDAVSPIKEIYFPKSVTAMLWGAFAFCDSLETVEYYGLDGAQPPVVLCDGNPFAINPKLKSIDFAMDNEGYGTDMYFEDCIGLENICMFYDEDDMTVDLINFISGFEYMPDTYEPTLKTIKIANGTKTVEGVGLYGIGVEEIIIPDTVTSFGEHLFCQCSADDVKESYKDSSKVTSSTSRNDSSAVASSSVDSDVDTKVDADISETDSCEVNPNITIVAPAGSYAESYAKENGIKFRAE